ncbi:MAG: FAD-dependent oxidoreductase [Truepera sp.]|nr:FAD-dependent oxidoreductase [Truepera sp.]
MQAVVVGAGIVGASCAFQLALRGAKVTVLERAPQPATGSTAKSAAGLRHQFSHPVNVRMSLYSSDFLRRFRSLTGHDPGFRESGYLFLIPPDLLEEWEGQWELLRELGAPVEVLDPDELRRRFPYIRSRGLASASFGPQDGVVDPHGITLGLLAGARERGAELVLGCEVVAARWRRGRWEVESTLGSHTADLLVNAAGPWAGELASRAGLELPVVPVRRMVFATAPFRPFAHPTPLIIDLDTGIYLRSEGERFLFGRSNPDEPPGLQFAIDWSWLDQVIELALPRFPFLERAGLDRRACWTGHYAITPDHLPILGRVPGVEGFINACGFSGHGVQHAPATGLIVAEEALDGRSTSFDLTDFRIERFTSERAAPEANII